MKELNLTLGEIIETLQIFRNQPNDGMLDELKQYKSIDELMASNNRDLISRLACWWGRRIGNRKTVIKYVTTSASAFSWAMDIGDHEYMKRYITDAVYAYWWARYIGNKELMLYRINKSGPALWWAMNIGDINKMKPIVTEQEHIKEWNRVFPNDQISL